MQALRNSSVRDVGLTNAFICGVGIAVAWGGISLAISAFSRQSLFDAGVIAFGIIWIFIFTNFLFRWLVGKSRCGPVQLDCGPHPHRLLFFINSALFALIGVTGSYGFFADRIEKSGTAGVLFGLSFGAFYLLMAVGHLQFRKNGIWAYCNLVKWQDIERYEWRGESDSTLFLQCRIKPAILGRSELLVPPDEKGAVVELLRSNCAADSELKT